MALGGLPEALLELLDVVDSTTAAADAARDAAEEWRPSPGLLVALWVLLGGSSAALVRWFVPLWGRHPLAGLGAGLAWVVLLTATLLASAAGLRRGAEGTGRRRSRRGSKAKTRAKTPRKPRTKSVAGRSRAAPARRRKRGS